MGSFSIWHWVIVLTIVILLFSRTGGTAMRFKIRNAFIAAAIYLWLIATIAQVEPVWLLVAMIYVAACMLLAKWMIDGAEKRRADKEIEFAGIDPAGSLGTQYGSFHHVFYSREPVIERFKEALTEALESKLGCTVLSDVSFKDVDKDLEAPETRTFFKANSAQTPRRSGFVLLCTFTRHIYVQGVRWWTLVSGVRNPNKVFWRYVAAPLSVPFLLIPYYRRRYDPLVGLTTIDPGFFNSVDILSRTREIQFVAFETLVETLDSFGIDTSDLKQQKGNILNINVSGGQTSFGSVVQGAFNKVTSAVGGGRKWATK